MAWPPSSYGPSIWLAGSFCAWTSISLLEGVDDVRGHGAPVYLPLVSLLWEVLSLEQKGAPALCETLPSPVKPVMCRALGFVLFSYHLGWELL